jgi:tetratricopeptide (TPR) repeat protein
MKKILFSLGLVLSLSTTFGQTNTEELNTNPTELAEKYNKLAKESLAKGNISQASESLAKLAKYENSKVWQVKNKDTKKDEFYYSQADLDTAVAKGNYAKPKEVILTPKYGFLLQTQVSDLANKELTAANSALDNKNYAVAGDKFINVYNLVEALGTKDEIYKYQAAISYYNANDFNKALSVIKDLAANNFTGVSANQPTNYNKDLYILGLNSLYNLKQYDTLLDEALGKYPKDIDINSIASSIYQITGNTDKLKTKIEENIKINPTDYLNYYNLGVLLMDDPAQEEKSRELFKKAIELNPKHVESYRNLTATYLKKDKVYVENINNNLGNSKQEKAVYNENLAKRKELFKDVIPYLEKIHELEPTDITIVKNLVVANRAIENTVKEEQYRALEKKLMGK